MTANIMESTSSITDRLRSRVDRVLERMRVALDLPSRSELQELTQRLEELDRRIAALAAERVGEMVRVVPALSAAAEPEAEPEADHVHVHDGDREADEVGVATIEASVTPAVGEGDPAQGRNGKRNKRNGRLRKK